ncbi:ankyrin repeat domain-containing protein [bacterium]|nr:ankyrin repeat domain-containing protein [bacterium]
MSEDNKTKFGNMPLGMINKMLVSFIGEDAFLDYCEKYHKDWKLDWQSREAFRKHLDRLFEEKESSYRDLNPHYDQSVYRIAFKILDDFCEQYGLPRYIADTILTFYGFHTLLTFQLSQAEYPICETHYMLDYVICGILHSFVKRTVNEIGKKDDICFSYLDAKEKYEKTFQELGKKFKDKNGEKSNLEKFYTKLSNWYSDKIKGQVLSDHFKKIIINNCKKGQNPAKWKDMKTILDFCKEKGKDLEVAHLIEAYLTANVQNFIKDKIPESDWKKIKSCFESIGKNVFNKFIAEKKKSGDTTYLKEDCLFLAGELLKVLHRILLDPLRDKSEPIRLARSEILENHIYLQDEKRAENLISNIKEIAPEAADFYCNWLLAYIAVAKGEFESAKKFYKAAFDNIHFAGICTEDFLKQAFALSVYCDSNRDTVRNAIDPKKDSKTPLPQDGKRFWEYGHAIGIFNKPTEEVYPELVYWRESFYTEFPQEMFFSDIEVSSDRTKPAPIGSFTVCHGNIKEKIEQDYNILCKLKKGNINTRMVNLKNSELQRRPPISVAIWLFFLSSNEGLLDWAERGLDLIESWLGLQDPKTAVKELDLNAIADLGETPLNAATMVYKDFCAKNSDPESPIKKRLKKIIIHILDETEKDYLVIATKRKGIHPLQNVIDSCDIDLVKEFVEKFVKVRLDIDKIEFTPKKFPPVYYTINRILELQDSQESTSGEQIKKLKEICLHLIDKTKNQDTHKFRNEYEAEWTSLTLAAKTDDVDICRALLEHGADPNISLETEWGNEIPNTFLHRCIEYEAWYALEMFLTEFKDEAAKTIKKYNNSGKYAPFVFFFEKNKEKRTGFMEKFIKLFESCGADFTINPTDECKKKP